MPSRAPHETTDVVVLGGGVAGLSAAACLRESGMRAIVLEARDRVGGRICTERAEDGATVELGAEFLHGDAAPTRRILERAGVEAADVRDAHHVRGARGLERDDDVFDAIDEFAAYAEGRDASVAAVLEDWAVDPRTKGIVRAYVEGFHGADPARFGVRTFRDEESAGSDALARVPGGYDVTARTLASDLDVRLGHVVRVVRFRRGRVDVETSRGGLRAKRAIVALPLGVLRARPGDEGAIAFDPPLDEKTAAARALGFATIVRVVLRFRERPWPADASFLHDPGAPIPTWWTESPIDERAIVGWVGGPSAASLASLDRPALRDCAVRSLARVLDVPHDALERTLASFHAHDWNRDPFARGAYAWVPRGAEGSKRVLAAPVDETLFFAGEATHEGSTGTVDGAIETGLRAAREVLASLA